jgi:hypothetical protein
MCRQRIREDLTITLFEKIVFLMCNREKIVSRVLPMEEKVVEKC